MGKKYDGIFFTPGMKGYSEEIVTIKKVYPPELYEEDRFFLIMDFTILKKVFVPIPGQMRCLSRLLL